MKLYCEYTISLILVLKVQSPLRLLRLTATNSRHFFSPNTPYGIRTRVTAVKRRCLSRLTNGAYRHFLNTQWLFFIGPSRRLAKMLSPELCIYRGLIHLFKRRKTCVNHRFKNTDLKIGLRSRT